MPKSYILGKVLFCRRTYGTNWIYCDLLECTTSISSEKIFAKKLQRIKPKIRVSQTFSPDAVNMTKSFTSSRHSAGGAESLRSSGFSV